MCANVLTFCYLLKLIKSKQLKACIIRDNNLLISEQNRAFWNATPSLALPVIVSPIPVFGATIRLNDFTISWNPSSTGVPCVAVGFLLSPQNLLIASQVRRELRCAGGSHAPSIQSRLGRFHLRRFRQGQDGRAENHHGLRRPINPIQRDVERPLSIRGELHLVGRVGTVHSHLGRIPATITARARRLAARPRIPPAVQPAVGVPDIALR